MPDEPEHLPEQPESAPAAESGSAPAVAPGSEPAAAGEPAPDPAAELAALQGRLDAAEAAERSAFIRADELAVVARKQSEMADELHAENRRLRDGEVREAVAPIVRGLARLADEVARLRFAAEEAGGAAKADDLQHVERRVLELLHDAGVVPVSPAAGDAFDVRLHEAAGSVATDDPLQDRTVLAVRRPGLIRDDGRILRPATVLVHRFDLTSPGDPA